MDFEVPGNHYEFFRLFDFKISGIISALIFKAKCISKHCSEDMGLQKCAFDPQFPTF